MERLFDAKPPSAEHPWHVLLYSDEVTPGNQLSPANSRKIQAIYWSFLEFHHRLSDENCWFTIATKRSSELKAVSGGMSQLFGVLLKRLFVDEAFELNGVSFTLASGRRIRIFAKLGFFIQDGGAHKITWHCKGDAGIKFCLCCRNVFSAESVLGLADGDGNVVCNATKVSQLDVATSAELKDGIRRIHARRGIDDASIQEVREKTLGFTYSGYNLMVDPELDDIVQPAEQFMQDWMHCIFVSGVWNICFQMVLQALWSAGIRDVYDSLRDYIKLWCWPRRVNSSKLHELFNDGRRKKNHEASKFKCSASEGLSLYMVVAMLFKVFGAICAAELRAHNALCDVIDLMYAVSRGKILPQQLQDAVELFLDAYSTAFGVDHMTPKFHWLLHFPKSLRDSGTLVACFVHERKHRMLKRYCNDIRNTTAFEHSVLAEEPIHRFTIV